LSDRPADAFDDLRSMGVPLKDAEALRDDLRVVMARGESGSPALAVHVSRGRIRGASAGRGRHVKHLVLETE
jgi:hypothetical protein